MTCQNFLFSVDFAQADPEGPQWSRQLYRNRRMMFAMPGIQRRAPVTNEMKEAALADFLSYLKNRTEKRTPLAFLSRMMNKTVKRGGFTEPDEIGFGTFDRRSYGPLSNYF